MLSPLLLLVLAAAPNPSVKPGAEISGSLRCQLATSFEGSQGVQVATEGETEMNIHISRFAQVRFRLKRSAQSDRNVVNYEGTVTADYGTVTESASSKIAGKTFSETTLKESKVVPRDLKDTTVSLTIDYQSKTYELNVPGPDIEATKRLKMPLPMGGFGEAVPPEPWPASFDLPQIVMPLPKSGDLSGSKAFEQVIYPLEGLPITGVMQCTWSLRPPSDEPTIAVDGPHCGCNPGEVIEVIATSETPGVKFDKFDVKSSGAAPTVLSNSGKEIAVIQLKGDGEKTGEVTLTATWRRGSVTKTSDPFKISFCKFKGPPTLDPSRSSIGEKDFVWDDSNSLEIALAPTSAYVNGKPTSADITWEISKKDAGKFETKTANGKGVIVSHELPRANDDFGKRQVFGRYSKSGCDCKSEALEVRLFFQRDLKNNPERKYPNWVYYWRQLSPAKGILFQFAPALPGRGNCTSALSGVVPPDDGAAAAYDFCADTIHISNRVFVMPNVPTSGCIERTPGAGTVDHGIDCFMVTVLHERRHQTDYTSWWGAGMVRHSTKLDGDNDSVPNTVELEQGCNPGVAVSCPSPPMPERVRGLVPDNDLFTYASSWEAHAPKSLQEKDWACPNAGHLSG